MDTEPIKNTPAIGPSTNRRGGVRTRGGRLPPIMMRPVESAKKSFVPNIPQRRAKPKDENVDSGIKRGDGRTKTGSSDRCEGRGSRRGRREYIQTVGAIFGAGLGPVAKKQSREAKDRPIAYKPIFNRSKKKSAKEIDEINKGIDGELEEYDGPSSDDSFTNEIIRLPLRKACNATIKKEVETEQETLCKTKQEEDTATDPEATKKCGETVTVKKEPEDIDQVTEEVEKIMSSVLVKTEPIDDYQTGDNPAVEPKVMVKEELASPSDVKPQTQMVPESEFLSENDDGQLLFIQFPTRMPFEKFVRDEPQPGPSTTRASPEPDMAGTDLKDMQEGSIGKLQFLKSGDVRLCLGNAMMGLHCENQLSCSLQAVSIGSQSEDDVVEIAVIGNIEKSLLCYPVAEDFLDKIGRTQ